MGVCFIWTWPKGSPGTRAALRGKQVEVKEQRLAWSPSLRLETASSRTGREAVSQQVLFRQPCRRAPISCCYGNLSANFFSFRSDGVQETLARYDNLIKACKGDPDAWELGWKSMCVPLTFHQGELMGCSWQVSSLSLKGSMF